MSLRKIIPPLNDAYAYQAFQLLRILAVLGIGIMLVKAGLSRETVSSYELFIFWGNILSFFWVMGIKNAAISYFPTLNSEQQKTFFFNLFLILQSLGVLVIILLGMFSRLKGFQTETFNKLGFYLPVYLALYAPTVLIEIMFILNKKAKRMLQYGVFIHLLQFAAIFFTISLSFELKDLFMALTLWMLFKWIYTVFLLHSYSQWKFSTNQIMTFGLFCIPLILHMLLGNGMEYIDGLIVSRYFDTGQFAIYRFGARELPVFLVMIGALSSVLIPIGVQDAQVAAEKIKIESRKLMHLFFPAILILLFISPELYRFFYSTDYRSSAFIFNIYLLIFASRIIMVEVFLYAKHQNKMLMWVSGIELLINLGLSLLLMNWFGLAGIAWATVVAFAISKLVFILYIYKKYEIAIHKYLDIRIYLFYSIALYLSHFMSLYLWNA